jgi:hypothetical protein
MARAGRQRSLRQRVQDGKLGGGQEGSVGKGV